MTTAGPNNAGTASSNSAAGTSFWTDPSNVTGASDASFAFFDAEASGDSEYLDVTNFGFSIPAGATIDGILFEVRVREVASADNIFDKLVKPLKAGTAVGTDQKSAVEWGTSFAYRSYGSSSSLLGTTWTYSDINASNFGIRIQAAESVGNNIGAEGRVEHVRCTITYTAAAGGIFTQTACVGLGCTGPKNFVRGNE
jgi:hypothetical protein